MRYCYGEGEGLSDFEQKVSHQVWKGPARNTQGTEAAGGQLDVLCVHFACPCL